MDPHKFNAGPYPDPAFFLIADPDPVPNSGVNDQKLNNIYSCKFFLYIFWIEIAIYLSKGLHKGRTKLQKPSALKREHPALQNMKIEIHYFFLYLWVIFALLDPDPHTLPKK